jgi:hypothetical protein
VAADVSPRQAPAGQNGESGSEGRHVTNVRDNGDNTITVEMSDGGTHGPFTLPSGPEGPQGPQGQPGEVSAQQLTDAIAGTANNPASIGAYSGNFSDPPTQSEMRAFRDWANNFSGATAGQ